MHQVYAFPNVGRSGLGNMLFPWARAEVFRKRHGVPMLAPRWTQPKIGPVLRGENDKRYYVGLFDNAGYVRGFARHLILYQSRKVMQAQAEEFMAAPAPGRHVVVFSGWKGWFDGIVPQRRFVAGRLWDILRPALKHKLEAAPRDYTIAVHIRRGDKPVMPHGAPFTGEYHGGMANEWFVNCIQSVREAVGDKAPVKVFTDANPGEIKPVLDLPGVSVAERNPSIVDIFLLSRAKVLVTTGTSSFSAWASYIGGMPTVWYPGLRLDLNPERPGLGVESDTWGMLSDAAMKVISAGRQAEQVVERPVATSRPVWRADAGSESARK